MNYNATFPVSAQNETVITGWATTYFNSSQPSLLLLLFGVLIIATLVSAYFESAGLIAIPLSLVALVGIIIVGMFLSDFAYNFATSGALSTTTSTYYSGILYIVENLPIIAVMITLAYTFVIVLPRRRNTSSTNGGRWVND
jgi:hypothetical protein